MPKFKWKGFNEAGKPGDGTVEASSFEDAAVKLKAQKLFVSILEPIDAVSGSQQTAPILDQTPQIPPPSPAAPA